MSTKTIVTGLDPAAAFPDPKRRPADAELPVALGAAAGPLESVLARLRALQPAVTTAWQYSDRVGWYCLQLLRKRRLLYIVPKRGDFRVSLILGGKAIADLGAGPFAARTKVLLKEARHYPEGTAFVFDRRSLDPELLVAFLEAKLAH